MAESSTSAPDAGGLIEIIDKLEALLNRSELSEIEVEAGQTAVVLKKPSAFSSAAAVSSVVPGTAAAGAETAQQAAEDVEATAAGGHQVLAPLTGLYYTSPSPGAEPYVREGGPVSAGQVIGLIEAMKLFNEIKSDISGRVLRIHAENGALVKAKQPLIEIEPT